MKYAMGQTPPSADAATQTDAATAPVVEYVASAPAVYAAPALVSTSTTPALVNDHVAPVLSDFLEPPVPVVQVVQVLQVQIIEQTVMTPATHCLVLSLVVLRLTLATVTSRST